MAKERIFVSIFLIISIIIVSCSSEEKTTGKAVATEPDIYEDVPQVEQVEQIEEQVETQINETEENLIEQEGVEEEQQEVEQKIRIRTGEEFYNETVSDKPTEKIEEFKFPQTSIVSTQHNISLSLDDFKHEIKDGYWGKIIEITMTVLNKGNKAFKPKVLVLLYDEKDVKEEWLKPKAEIEFDIAQLNIGEHITRQAIVNIAFDDINLTKNFKMILVDAADPGNKAIVVVENEFKPT